MTTITSSSTIGINLNPASYTNPVIIEGGVSVTNPNYNYGVYRDPGSTAFFVIQNNGAVSGSDSAPGVGVYLAPGGSVTNATSGSITGYTGVKISGGVGTVVNNGSINGTEVTGYFTRGIGVDLLSGGSVTNTSAASIVGGSFGVAISGGAGTVVNRGSIASTGGSIPSSGFGIDMTGSPGTVVNYGSISGGAMGGVNLASGGSVTNAASASIIGFYRGVQIYGGAGTVVNDGSIAGDAASSEGILLGAAGGSITNEAAGSITGLIGVDVNSPSGGPTAAT